MYTFQDKANRSLTLRPENTASVVRAIIENNLFNEIFPLRFFYIGPMFRYDKPQKGRYRQFHQFGAEVIGDSSAQVDAELIYSSVHFLKEVNIHDIYLHINSVGCIHCRPKFLKDLEASAQKYKNDLCEDCQRKVHTNPLRIFDCKNKSCIETSKNFPKITDHLCEECDTHFNELKEGLSTLEIPYKINPRMVRGLDYYTKTTFEIISDKLGAQDSILGGGRYDYLIKEFGGENIPATGFAAGIERIILHLEDISFEKSNTFFIAYQSPAIQKEAIKLVKSLWDNGFTAYIEYNAKNLKKQFKKSDRIGADFTFILGEDEIKSSTISIKNMETQEQVNIKKGEIFQWLEKNC